MSLTIELACTKSAMVDEANPNNNYSGQTAYNLNPGNGNRRLYLEFEPFPEALRNYDILSTQLVISISNLPDVVRLYLVSSQFDASTITWNNKPTGEYDSRGSFGEVGGIHLPSSSGAFPSVFSSAKRLRSPAYYLTVSDRAADYMADASTAKLVVTYDPDVTVGSQIVSLAPALYVNPRISNTFNWTFSKTSGDSYNTAYGITQASAKFFWKAVTSENYTEVSTSGSAQQITIPANTFPIGSLQYYIEATDNLGNTSQTPIYTTTTADSLRISSALSPINTVEDGGAQIVFCWSSSVSTGTAQTGADVWWKLPTENNQSWHVLGHVEGAGTTLTAPANTFTAGAIQWMVRTYNTDGVVGSWSSVGSFVCVAAPLAPSVNTDAAPFTTISWQVEGQQAYRITVDGKIYGPYFGEEKSFTLPDYLSDGEHSASVEVQGLYGLWSQPGTIRFTVANVPGAAILLQGSFAIDAELSWQTASSAADFLIYRDDVRIGHTAGNSFTDRLVLGQHSYFVINRLPGGNYSLSNTVSGCLRSCTTRIALAAGGAWMELKLSANSMDEQRFTYSRAYSLRHMTGAEYPVLELSPYLEASGSYNTAFTTVEQAQAFEALKGQVVILKSRGGNVVIGALTDLQKKNGTFFIAYDFTIQRCHWEDYLDDANG